MIRSSSIAALVVSLLAPSTSTFAQSAGSDPARPLDQGTAQASPLPTAIRQAAATYDFTAKTPSAPANLMRAEFQAGSVGRNRSVSNKVAGGILGAVVGFFGGAAVGGWIAERRCQCGEPLEGIWIGALIGGTAGGIIGVNLF